MNNRIWSLGHLAPGRRFGSVVIPEAAFSAFASLQEESFCLAFELERGAFLIGMILSLSPSYAVGRGMIDGRM